MVLRTKGPACVSRLAVRAWGHPSRVCSFCLSDCLSVFLFNYVGQREIKRGAGEAVGETEGEVESHLQVGTLCTKAGEPLPRPDAEFPSRPLWGSKQG